MWVYTSLAALAFMVRSKPRAHQHTLLLSLALALALALALDVQPVVPIRLAIYCGRKRQHHTRDKPTHGTKGDTLQQLLRQGSSVLSKYP